MKIYFLLQKKLILQDQAYTLEESEIQVLKYEFEVPFSIYDNIIYTPGTHRMEAVSGLVYKLMDSGYLITYEKSAYAKSVFHRDPVIVGAKIRVIKDHLKESEES